MKITRPHILSVSTIVTFFILLIFKGPLLLSLQKSGKKRHVLDKCVLFHKPFAKFKRFPQPVNLGGCYWDGNKKSCTIHDSIFYCIMEMFGLIQNGSITQNDNFFMNSSAKDIIWFAISGTIKTSNLRSKLMCINQSMSLIHSFTISCGTVCKGEANL